MIKVDTSAMEKFRLTLGNAKVDDAIKACLVEAVSTALRQTKENTHTISGTLRREWKITGIEKDGKYWVVTLYNDAKYAMYVEYGHRTRLNRKTNTRGWVPGQYMMKLACDEVQKNMDKIVDKHMKEFCKKMGFK